jgi:hypothetical protein
MRLAANAVLVLSLATNLSAQTSATRARVSLGFRLPIGAGNRSAVCDGSEMAGVHTRRQLGTILFAGGLATILLAPQFVHGTDPNTATSVMSAGVIASGIGVYLRYNSNPSQEFWQGAISQIKVGETRAEDVRQCFGSPSGTTASGAEATWTYTMSKTGFLGLGGSSHSLNITLKDGLVSKVLKSDFGY